MKKNNAFTIAEAIISFILIGMMFVLTLSGLTRKTDYHQLYLQAFDILYQASKSSYKEWYNQKASKCNCELSAKKRDLCQKAECWRNSKIKNPDNPNMPDERKNQERTYEYGTKYFDRDWPGFLYGNNDNGIYASSISNPDFCENLTKNINTLTGSKCQNFIYKIDNLDVEPDKNAVKFYNLFMHENKDGRKISGISPTFTASNGMQFYISDVVTANFKFDSETAFNHTSRENYRLVVVDLNGKSLPNSQFKKGTTNPDLVLFAINATGDVIPLGLPEFSKEYINASVYYPNYQKSDGTRIYKEKSHTMTLWDAKQKAWGYTREKENYINISPISKAEPLSQSAKLYKIAEQCRNKECSNMICTKEYTDQSSNSARDIKTTCLDNTTKVRYADNLLVNLILQFMYIKEGELKGNKDDFYGMQIKTFLSTNKTDCCLTGEERKSSGTCTINKDCGCNTVESENIIPACSLDFE